MADETYITNELTEELSDEALLGAVENILFAAGSAVKLELLAQTLGVKEKRLDSIISAEASKRQTAFGLLIRRFDDSIQLAARPEARGAIEAVLGVRTEEELTRAMVETLAIIAYKQPVTRQEIEELRGVNSSYMISSLCEKGLIREVGKKEALGRPILYGTDEAFLRHFDLEDITKLPPLPAKAEGEEEDKL